VSAAADVFEDHAAQFVTAANAEEPGSVAREIDLDMAALLLSAAREAR